VLNLQMKFFVAILLIAIAAAGCETKSKARAQARAAFLAGQNSILQQQRQQQQQASSVTIIGPVQNPQVPWVDGLTLAQAIATADYLDSKAPKEIIITRDGQDAKIDPSVLLRGTRIPLEAGDVITLR
jgi:hypothetical protein